MAQQEHPGQLYTLHNAEDHIGDLRGQVDVLNEVLAQNDTDLTPNTPAAGNTQFSTAGHQRYIAPDGNAYNTGRLTLPCSSALNVTTSLQTVPGLSAALTVGTWRIHAQLLITNPGTAGQGNISIQMSASGGLTANGRCMIIEVGKGTTVDIADFANLGTTLTGGTAPGTGGLNRACTIDGLYIVTVAGTVNVQVSQAATAAITVAQNGSFLEALPVS